MIEPQEGEEYYVPFWILLDYLDPNPPDPFVKVIVVKVTQTSIVTGPPEMPTLGTIKACDVDMQGTIVPRLPLSYLLTKHDLIEWADRLADWFTDFAKEESCKS